MSSALIGGLYRFQGEASVVTNNYICFGTGDENLCKTAPEKYMYRIIGKNDKGNLKLIKNTAITSQIWNTFSKTLITWDQSDLYPKVNNSLFLYNTEYVPDSTWRDKIDYYNWETGIAYSENQVADKIYQTESSKVISSKIGLMSLTDYYYQSVSNNCSETNGTYLTCKNGWMGNDGSLIEWTMSSTYDSSSATHRVYAIHNSGYAYEEVPDVEGMIRPTFYLRNDVAISGNGTINSPYMVS